MAEYIVTNGAEKIGPYDNLEATACKLMEKIWRDDPIGWHIEKVSPKDVPELIPDAEAAREYLNIPHDRCHPIFGDEDVADSLLGVPVETLSQVEAFRDLLLLCKAWNKADGWEPDWKNTGQEKCYPQIFTVDGSVDTASTCCHAKMPFVFRTSERAKQFGEKFIGLFKQLYGIGEGE